MQAFLNEFKQRGCTLNLGFDEFVRHSYAASAGHIGLLSRFFIEVATLIKAPCEITRQLCVEACNELNLPGDGSVKPFNENKLSDIDLMHVLAAELDRYDLPLAPLSVAAELAQVKVEAKHWATV